MKFNLIRKKKLYESTETVDGRTSYPMTMTYLYDSLDRTKEVRYPAQYGLSGSPRKIIEPTYDTASRLSSLKVDSVVQAGDIIYNSSDQMESIKIGTAGTNQVTETYQYDGLSGLLTNQKVIKGGNNLLDLNYDYAKNNSVGTGTGKTGHLTKITDNLNNAKNKEYEFDALGRLTKAKGGTNNLWQQQYGYDRYGNRETVAASGNGIDNAPMQADGMSYSTDKQTNRITNTGFEYDVAGNLTRGLDQNGVWLKYEYDAANRLQVIKKDSDNSYVQAFQFGSTNQRLMDIDYGYGYLKIFGHGGAVEYTEFAGNVLSWTKTYVYLGERLLSTISPNGNNTEKTEFNHPDKLGTRVTTEQQNGTHFEQNTLPFGSNLAAETSGTKSKRFTSYERSNATGLDYAINRTYDNKLGRFTQVDPIGMKSTDLNIPQTLNLYNYCGNDPINHLDPNGLSWFSKLFRIFRTIVNLISNIIRIAITVAVIISLIVTPIGWAATIGVIAVLAFQAIIPNLISIVARTIYNNIKQEIRENGLTFGSFFRGLWRGIKQSATFLKSIFTRSIKDYFGIVYGYFCGPGYGIDGPTRDQNPIDELDRACSQHDRDLRGVDEMLRAGLISKREAKRLKTKFDLRFMRRAIVSGNQASGGYLLILQISFIVRVFGRLFN